MSDMAVLQNLSPTTGEDNWLLPTERQAVLDIDPLFLIVYARHKVGKTAGLAILKNCLILDLEKGSTYQKAMRVKVIGLKPPALVFRRKDGSGINMDLKNLFKRPDGSYDISACQPARWNRGETQAERKHRQREKREFYLTEVIDLLALEEAPRYQYLALDTASKLDEWCEIEGTYRYMASTQGKKFNRWPHQDPNGEWLHHTDERWESVHTLPEGFGYRWSREVMIAIIEKLRSISLRFILACHTMDNKQVNKKTGEEALVRDIKLTGAVKGILCREAAAIGYLFQEGEKTMISFKTDDEAAGSWCAHLAGQVIHLYSVDPERPDLITESHWDKIYTQTPV